MNYGDERFEDFIFRYVDQVKEFLAPEIWQNLLMDCSKNEIFVLWLYFGRRLTTGNLKKIDPVYGKSLPVSRYSSGNR